MLTVCMVVSVGMGVCAVVAVEEYTAPCEQPMIAADTADIANTDRTSVIPFMDNSSRNGDYSTQLAKSELE